MYMPTRRINSSHDTSSSIFITVTRRIHLFCHMTIGSDSRSLISTAFLFAITSGCGVVKSQPMWAKKKPLFTLWGSASVSLYLWCTLWSNAHAYTCFCERNVLICKIRCLWCLQRCQWISMELLSKAYILENYKLVRLWWTERLKLAGVAISLCKLCGTIICAPPRLCRIRKCI